jgi:MFS family permease
MATDAAGQIRPLAIICLASFGWAFAFGLSAPLISIGLHEAGSSATIIGLNTAVYYSGLALAALLAPRLMRRFGPKCAAVAMVLSGFSLLALPCLPIVGWWFVLRFINGAAGAISLIPLETYVNRDLASAHRARNFSLYTVSLTLGWAAGNWFGLGTAAEMPGFAFLIGALAAILSGGLIQLALPVPLVHCLTAGPRVRLGIRDNILGFGSAWAQGFLEGGMVAFLSLYLLEIGLSEGQTGELTSATMLGVIAFQIPVAWLADRAGRLPMLMICYGMTAVGLTALPLTGSSGWLPVWLFTIGAFSGALYPLGLAYLGERLPRSELDRANAAFLSLECVGSLVGPAIMGVARDTGGDAAMFAMGTAAVLIVPVAWLVFRLGSQEPAGSRPTVEVSSKAA